MPIPQIIVTSGDDQAAKQRLAHLVQTLRGQMTQREFAKQLGTSYTSVQDWEKQVRLPSDKNLKRIAELKGWTQEELIRYIFCSSTQPIVDTTVSLDEIITQVNSLSLDQMQQLMDYLTVQLSEADKGREKGMRRYLSDKQKHNLHLLLRASLKGQSPTEVMVQAKIDPPLFTDIFLRNSRSRVVAYEDLEQFSSLCYRVIKWAGNQLPQIDRTQTYAGATEQLFDDLAKGSKAGID